MWLPSILFLITGATCFIIPSDEGSDNTCSHPDCMEYAKEIADSLNRSVNPCENFFEYACGGWNKRHPAPMMQSSGIMLEQMMKVNDRIQHLLETDPVEGEDAVNKARHSFKTCMEYDHATFVPNMLEIIQTMGGWPLIEGISWNSKHYYPSLSEALPTLAQMRLIKPQGALFSIQVIPNVEDLSSPKLALLPPNFNALPLPPIMNQRNRVIIMAQLLQTAKAFNPAVDNQQASQDISDMFKLNDILYSFVIHQNTEEKEPRNAKTAYTIAELEAVTKVQWLKFFSILLEGTAKVEPNTVIEIPQISMYYLYQVIQLISQPNFNSRALINYEMLGIVNPLAQVGSILGQGKGSITFNSMFSPSKNIETFINLTRAAAVNKGAVCTQLLSQSYGYAVAWKYVLEYDDLEKQRQVAKEMTENIFHVFGEKLKKIVWMDEISRTGAEKKINNMKGHYVYPDWNEHLNDVNDFYGEMTSADNFIKEYTNSQKFLIKVELKEYAKIAKYPKWVMPPMITNAYYYQLDNAMRILDGIMQKPMFNPNRLRAMNYGSLGMIIGHEITHGFDQNGVLYDLNGKPNPWMSESSKKHFDERAQCFKDQYSGYVMTSEDLPGSSEYHINGENTANENIADNGGIQQSYWAYQHIMKKFGPEVLPDVLKEFSPEQLFFLSFAHTWCTNYGANPQWSIQFDQDNHCVNKFRVIGTLTNFDEFHKHFGCFPGDKMVNDKQCVIW